MRAEGEDPILILDDVFATLDAERRAALASVARSAEQTLITAAVLDDVPAELRGARSRSATGIAVVVKDAIPAGEGSGRERASGPARPSDIARAALEAARAASAARPQPTRRRIAGPRRTWTGAGPGADDPQPLGRLVDSLVTEQDWSERTRVGAVFGRWEALVGPEIAAHCAPQTLTEGELLVVAESTAWATQLRLLAPTILGKLRAQVGGDVVTRLRVVGPTAPSWKKGPRSVRGRGPRDTYG